MELTKVNKHVMTDGIDEYYRNEKGQWMPGYYHNGTFWWVRTRKFAARHRHYELRSGEKFTVRLTRYTYRKGSKPAYAPIGKNGQHYQRARLETVKDVMYRNGVFYVACNLNHEDGTHENWVKPFSGVLYDAYQDNDIRLYVNEGRVYSYEETEGARIDISPDMWDDLAAYLQIADVDPKQDRTASAPAPEKKQYTVDDTSEIDAALQAFNAACDEYMEKVFDENESIDAERTAWIEATTNEGDQLDLIQWFGYGDASWQELAAPAA